MACVAESSRVTLHESGQGDNEYLSRNTMKKGGCRYSVERRDAARENAPMHWP